MIVSSAYTTDAVDQVDGRFWVREVHLDDQGVSHEYPYLAPADADPQAIMTERAAALNAQSNDGVDG